MSSIIPPVLRGSTVSASGAPGLVPRPSSDDRARFLRGDGTWVTLEGLGLGDMLAANNLSDVTDPADARDNLLLRASAAVDASGTYDARDHGVTGDGTTDDQPALQALFAAVALVSGQKTVIIPPGSYALGLASGNEITIPSNVTVIAVGAKFLFPTTIPGTALNYPKPSAFIGVDISDFTWVGGEFVGYVFNPDKAGGYATNAWAPKEGARSIYLTSTSGNGCHRIVFSGIKAVDTGGEVVSVNGTGSTYCTNIELKDCTFTNCGPFMWDYGYLWQILTFEADGAYTADQVAMADEHIIASSKIGAVTMANGSDTVAFDNDPELIAISASAAYTYTVSFYGTTLPSNITRGLRYYVVASSATGIKVSATYGGSAITFASAGSGAKMFYNMTNAYENMYLPTGMSSSSGKGAHEFVLCDGLTIAGNTWSAPGDSMHVYQSTNVVIEGNRITDARMGAMFLEDVENVSIVGNMVNGGNGSRILTLEIVSNATLIGNSFIGGGRGSILNDLAGVVFSNNTFYKNNTKSTTSFPLGRKNYTTGDWVAYPAMSISSDYAVDFEDVSFVNNRVHNEYATSGWLVFNRGGSGLRIGGNTISGDMLNINFGVSTSLFSNVSIGSNPGMTDTVIGFDYALRGHFGNSGLTSPTGKMWGRYSSGTGALQEITPDATDFTFGGTFSLNTVGVAKGGTGAVSLTGLIKGNGVSPMTAAVANTDYVAPGGNIGAATGTSLSLSKSTSASGDTAQLNVLTTSGVGATDAFGADIRAIAAHSSGTATNIVAFRPLARQTSAQQVTNLYAVSPTVDRTSAGLVTFAASFNANDISISVANQIGYRGQMTAGANKYNLYMDGSAANYLAGDLRLGKTITDAGTVGAQTIDKTAGSVNIASGATSIVITNSLVTVNSVIICTVATNDGTCRSIQAVAGAGSFTMYPDVAPTAETRVNFLVVN